MHVGRQYWSECRFSQQARGWQKVAADAGSSLWALRWTNGSVVIKAGQNFWFRIWNLEQEVNDLSNLHFIFYIRSAPAVALTALFFFCWNICTSTALLISIFCAFFYIFFSFNSFYFLPFHASWYINVFHYIPVKLRRLCLIINESDLTKGNLKICTMDWPKSSCSINFY